MNPFDYTFFFNRKLISVNPESPVSLTTDYLFNKLNRSTRNSYHSKLALNNILCNLITASLNGRYLIISKSPNDYSNYTWYGLNYYTYRHIVGWIELLIKERYINHVKGYYDSSSESGKKTRLWIDEKLISSFEDFRKNSEEILSANYTRPIVLKDKSKNIIQYKLSGQLLDKIRFLNKYNEFIKSCEILFPLDSSTFDNSLNNIYPLSYINLYHILFTQLVLNQVSGRIPVVERGSPIPLLITLEPKSLFCKKLQGRLYRVFNNRSLSQGGRFYSGGSYQQLNEKDRAKIIINGLPVTEVDYSAYHLNILYNITGKQFDKDPYSIVDRPEVRPILKVLCLIVINSKDKGQALRALKNEIRKNREFQKLKRIYDLDERELLRKFESVHFEISNYFYSGIGLRLQYKDSQIAQSILNHFTRREIPCLCVHDSFLVPAEHKDELGEVMIINYRKRFGFVPKIK